MTKLLKNVSVAVIAVLILAAVLVSCTTTFKPLTGGEPNADSESNNGYVVKQGDYYYFINGYAAASSIEKASDNKHGNVIKGALMRAKKNDKGGFDEGAGEIVVPMIVTSTNTTQGFSIFGEYIYYTTPSVKTDKYGKLQTNYQEFNRCKITGAGTETIATLSDSVKSYKFTPDALLYLDGSDIKRVNYKSKATETVAESTSNQIFPAGETYKNGKVAPDNYVFYTVIPENTDGTYNELYAVTGSGEPIKLAGDKTFGENKKITLTPKYVVTENSGEVVLYYEKTDRTDGRSDALGLFGVKLGSETLSADFKIDSSKEKRFTVNTGLTVTPYMFDKGVMVDSSDDESKFLYFSNVDDNGNPIDAKKYRYPSSFSLTINSIRTETRKNADGADAEYPVIYYTNSNSLYLVELGDNSFIEGSSTLITSNIKTDWLKIERIGNDVFIMNTTYLTYMHVFNIDQINDENFDKSVGLKRKDLTLIGKMTEDDKKSYDKIVKEENEKEEEKQ